MNTPKLSLDSIAAATVLTIGLFVASAGGFAGAPALAGAAAPGAQLSLTQDGTMKMTVTAARDSEVAAPSQRTARSLVHAVPAKS